MKIIVYDDNPDFGGHQILTCHGMEALASNAEIELIVIINPSNHRLQQQLAGIERMRVIQSPRPIRRFRTLSSIDKSRIHKLAELFKSFEADLLLCIQGDMQQSTAALIAAREIGLESISYLALPHSMANIGVKLGALRERLNNPVMHTPNRYITISESMAGKLRERGIKTPIVIVPNGIPHPLPTDDPVTTQSSRFTLGMLGRIEFSQKRQDFMVRTFCSESDAFSDCRLLIAGDGPDRERLEQLIAHSSRHDDITLLPWQADPYSFFASINLLAIPSRYEGVPLVMLEALGRGIPVIGSNRDGMRDMLPTAWTFEPDDVDALAKTFARVRSTWEDDIAPLQQRVLTEHSLEVFKANFVTAVQERF